MAPTGGVDLPSMQSTQSDSRAPDKANLPRSGLVSDFRAQVTTPNQDASLSQVK
jgi:hypothetical protein